MKLLPLVFFFCFSLGCAAVEGSTKERTTNECLRFRSMLPLADELEPSITYEQQAACIKSKTKQK
ncbi:hypothetical protein [Acinetobacter sp. A47]|uniref:hypothetical protein n=1 Tax=Acinetobacter sp. A47 TaxID=1561217 RepID=UPI001269BE15|nr:hypothetical protein [Acinetobacter sp. A47]